MEALNLKPTLHERCKLLWTQERDRVIVTKGTPHSSFRKTMLRKNGTTAVPRHIREALKLRAAPYNDESVLWIRKGNAIIVRKNTRMNRARASSGVPCRYLLNCLNFPCS
jgi:hypothetical protein